MLYQSYALANGCYRAPAVTVTGNERGPTDRASSGGNACAPNGRASNGATKRPTNFRSQRCSLEATVQPVRLEQLRKLP
jgi:hypothetical protein